MVYAGLDLSRKRLDFHLAARAARACRARARPLALAPGASPIELEAARARCSAHAWQALSGLGSLRCARPPAPRQPWATGAVAGHDRGEPAPDRRARPRDRRVRARAAPPRR